MTRRLVTQSADISSSLYREYLVHKADLVLLRLELAHARHEWLLRKYDPNQPRVPAGSSDGGQWTNYGGSSRLAASRHEEFSARRRTGRPNPIDGVRTAITAALELYAVLSGRNRPDSRTIIEASAREFRSEIPGVLDIDNVRQINQEEVDSACPKLGEVQGRTDQAVINILRDRGYLSPTDFGTAVHADLKKQIDALDDPNFIAERSYEKGDDAGYSKKGTVRIDVLENIERTNTVCVYDIKTGASGLSRRRMFEIAKNVYGAFPHTKRFVVTEVRPKPW